MSRLLLAIMRFIRRLFSRREPPIEWTVPIELGREQWDHRLHIPAEAPSDLRPTPQSTQLRSSGSNWQSNRPPPMPVVPPATPRADTRTIRECPRPLACGTILPSATDFGKPLLASDVLPPQPNWQEFPW